MVLPWLPLVSKTLVLTNIKCINYCFSAFNINCNIIIIIIHIIVVIVSEIK